MSLKAILGGELPKEVQLQNRIGRLEFLYDREKKEKVIYGRKLAQYDRNFGRMRDHVTECCAAMRLFGMDPNSATFLNMRNAVRLMKGKNEL